jgi:hypothetical protein
MIAVIISVTAVSAESLAIRSARLLPVAIDLDSRTAAAFSARSLDSLTKIYAELGAAAAASEAARKTGQDACGCDVAFANLRIVVGFAVNKLDGKGRYQSWMQSESQRLRGDFESMLKDCAADARVASVTVRLQAQIVKGL